MKQKTTKVYKVVRECHGGFGSAYAPTAMAQIYNRGVVTVPVPGTKLFAFTDLKQARDYRNVRGDGFHVFIAQATNVESNGWFNTHMNRDYTIACFRDHSMPKPPSHLNSCVVCDSIKLTRIVK